MINNSSSFSLPLSFSLTTHVVLNIISFMMATLGLIICVLMLSGVLLRRRTLNNVQLLLCANNYLIVSALGIGVLVQTINTIKGDMGLLINEEETLECRVQGYILFSLISAMYQAFALQAVFRLIRIFNPNRLRLIEPRIYLIIIPLLWIVSFVLVSPLFIWHGQKLIPGEYVCRIPKDDVKSIAYSMIIIYALPFNCVAFVYFQVSRHFRQQARLSNFYKLLKRRQRDVIVLRRIVITTVILGSFGMPTSIMLIMFAITNELVPCFYRILELSIAVAVLSLSVTLIYIDPQLKKKIGVCETPRRRVNT